MLDYDAQGNLTGIDVDNASTKVEIRKLVVSKAPGLGGNHRRRMARRQHSAPKARKARHLAKRLHAACPPDGHRNNTPFFDQVDARVQAPFPQERRFPRERAPSALATPG